MREGRQRSSRGLARLRRLLSSALDRSPDRRLHRQLSAVLSDLGPRRRALSKLGTTLEHHFVAMGSSLEAQSALSAKLVTAGDRLAGAAEKSPGDDAVHAAVTLIQRTMDAIDECRQRSAELIAQLDRYHAQTGRLLKEEEGVERVLAPLRIIQTLFRIEAALLPAEMQAGFNALSSEIPKFELEVRTTFSRHAESMAETRCTIEAAVTRLQDRARVQAETNTTNRVRIAGALAQFEREQAAARTRNQRLAEIIRDIDQQIRALVVSLQYQDITRQKMDHVGEALDEAVALTGTVTRDRLPQLHRICRVESLQLEVTRKELDLVLNGIAGGVQKIHGCLGRIETDCWPRADFKTIGHSVQERTSNLQSLLREARDLLPHAVACADDALRVTEAFGQVTANVATKAHEMAESMRLIALNAQVLAAQAGDRGAGLLVLAERTYAISGEIRTITDCIGREFVEASRQLDDVVQQCARLKECVAQCRAALEQHATPIEQRLQTYCEEIGATLTVVGELLENLHARADEMQRATEGKIAFCDELVRLSEHLTSIATTCEASPACHVGRDSAELPPDGLEQRYTMDTERAIHSAVLSAMRGEQRPLLPAANCAYACAEPADVAASTASPQPAPLGDNVELF